MYKERFLDMLKEKDDYINTVALIGLSKYPDEDTAEAVVEFMKDADLPLKQKAAVVLGKLGERGKYELEKILRGGNPELISYAMLGYSFVENPDKDLVEKHLWSGDVRVVQSAAITFAKCWPEDVIDALDPLFGHIHDGVRCHTLPYVFVDTENPEAINHLTFVYRRAGEHLREHILDAIKRGIRKNPDLMKKTISIPAILLADEQEEAPEAIEDLRAMLRSSEETIRWKASHEVVSKPPEIARELIEEMLKSDDSILVRRALAYILDHDTPSFAEELFTLLSHNDPDVRVRAVLGLVQIDLPEERLIELAEDSKNRT